jgi:hypothetical protein
MRERMLKYDLKAAAHSLYCQLANARATTRSLCRAPRDDERKPKLVITDQG